MNPTETCGCFLMLFWFRRKIQHTFEGDVTRTAENARINAETDPDTARVLGGITPHHGIALDTLARFYERI